MSNLALGLIIALGGAFLLATGSEMQSAAVAGTDGKWTRFVKSPRWLLGSLLLGVAIGTNFLALALAPVSAIQSMSIVALALSALIGICAGRIEATKSLGLGVFACLVGILGFIWIITGNHNPSSYLQAHSLLPTVVTTQALVAVCGGVCLLLNRFRSSNLAALVGMMLAAVQFGTITTVFKVLVEITLQTGITTLTGTKTLLALLSVSAGGIVAIVLLQQAHRVLAPPTVVAALTIVDTITVATIGTLVLHETTLTTGNALLLLLCAAVAITGVGSLRGVRRKTAPPQNTFVPTIQTPKESSSHAHRVLQ